MAAAVVAYRQREAGDLGLQGLKAELVQAGVGLNQAIEVGHVAAMVAVMVERHRGGIDRRLQGGGAIGQGRQAVGGPGRQGGAQQQAERRQAGQQGPGDQLRGHRGENVSGVQLDR